MTLRRVVLVLSVVAGIVGVIKKGKLCLTFLAIGLTKMFSAVKTAVRISSPLGVLPVRVASSVSGQW